MAVHSRFRVHASAIPLGDELVRVPGSAISGVLFVEVGDLYFPAQHWGDYVVPVLGWWLDSAMSLSLPDHEARFIVMDGPYAMRMRRAAGTDSVRLTLWRNGQRIDEHDHSISYMRCLAALRGAAKCVLNELRELGYSCDGETGTLQARLEHLLRLEEALKNRGLS